nr:MAG TPA: TMEM151 family [Caudoviricetes sp.]
MDEIGRLIGRLIGCLIMTVLVLLCVAAVLWCMQLVAGLVA